MHYELIYLTKRGKEACYGDFEGDENRAVLYQQWLEYVHGRVCWIERT